MYNNYANRLFRNQLDETVSDSLNMYNFKPKHMFGGKDDDDDEFDGGFPPLVLKKTATDKKNPAGVFPTDNKYVVSIHKILESRKNKTKVSEEETSMTRS